MQLQENGGGGIARVDSTEASKNHSLCKYAKQSLNSWQPRNNKHEYINIQNNRFSLLGKEPNVTDYQDFEACYLYPHFLHRRETARTKTE